MEKSEMKKWIDGATYEQLLSKRRFAPIGSPWFQGEIGEYYTAALHRKKSQITAGEAVAASKHIGWD